MHLIHNIVFLLLHGINNSIALLSIISSYSFVAFSQKIVVDTKLSSLPVLCAVLVIAAKLQTTFRHVEVANLICA